MSRNPMSVYVLKLLSLRKSGSFSVSIDLKCGKFNGLFRRNDYIANKSDIKL